MEDDIERTWRLTKRSYSIFAEVSAPLYDALLRVLESGASLSISDYLRDLVEKDIKERGIELAPLEAFGGEGIGDEIGPPMALDSGVISTRVPKLMMDMVNKVLESGLYLSVSSYLRDVVKKDLESRGIEPKPIKAVAGEDKKPAKTWRPSEAVSVSTQVPMAIMEDVDHLLASGFYLRVSDYLIDLIRKDLEARGLRN